jgi:ubiquinone/menaquinone biosynthesis C-methylase UbiE
MHVNKRDGHFFALAFLVATLDHLDISSILDIGSGTGRAIQFIKERRPDIRIVGIEPVEELRRQGYARGLSENDLVEGDANRLIFQSSEFDLVCEFGMLHHVRRPGTVISEMLRVARKAIFISDSNNFGQGSFASRSLKQAANLLGLWKLVNFLKTRGKGYTFSKGDGLVYSYSVFNNYKQIKSQCDSVHLLNTGDAKINPYTSAAHVTLLGVKSTGNE